MPPAVLGDARVVAGREPVAAGARREREQLGEAEAAVAADARVRRLAARVAADERRDDGAAELLAQVERDVRQPEPVAGLARGDHGVGRAARALRVGPLGIEPEAQRDADRVRHRAQQRDGAVDAAAHRDRRAAGTRLGAEHRPERGRERVDRERLAADGRSLEQRQSDEPAVEPFRVRRDDPVAVDGELHRGPVAVARGISEGLDHDVTVTKMRRGLAAPPQTPPCRSTRAM